jgi:hypothetical protein
MRARIAGCPYDRAIRGYRVTFRTGSKVSHEHFDAPDDALSAVERRLRSIGNEARRAPTSFFGREFEPAQQVAARAELSGPRRLRAGIDLRGDGSAEAWTGKVVRRLVELQPGEDAYAALRRVLTG